MANNNASNTIQTLPVWWLMLIIEQMGMCLLSGYLTASSGYGQKSNLSLNQVGGTAALT